MQRGFAYAAGYTLTPAPPPAGFSYLPASPHRSTTTTRGPAYTPTPEGTGAWAVSTGGFVVGASSRVREYQPVVHRLRLTASP